MEDPFLLHEWYERLTSFRYEESFFLCSFLRKFGGPHTLEVSCVSEHQLGVEGDSILWDQVLDVIFRYTRHPIVDVFTCCVGVLTEVLLKEA